MKIIFSSNITMSKNNWSLEEPTAIWKLIDQYISFLECYLFKSRHNNSAAHSCIEFFSSCFSKPSDVTDLLMRNISVGNLDTRGCFGKSRWIALDVKDAKYQLKKFLQSFSFTVAFFLGKTVSSFFSMLAIS